MIDLISLGKENVEFSDKFLLSLGLDEISSERETISRQRTAAAKVESRKNLVDNDEDYEPKLTEGCHTIILLLCNFPL